MRGKFYWRDLRPYVLVTTSYNLASYSSQLRLWSNKRHGRLWPDNLFIWTNNVGCTVLKKGEMGFYLVLFCVCQINKFILSVCTCVSNKRQNGWTDQVQILCGTSTDPRVGLWMIKISNISSIKIRFSLNFESFKNLRNFCLKSANIFLFIHKESMFTHKIEDRREAP